MHEAGFVTGPARSTIAEAQFQIGKVGARVRASILAGLPPKRQPLARMAIADSLGGAHIAKYVAKITREAALPALQMSSELLQRVAEAVADGRIVAPPITRISLEEVPAALSSARARPASGKTVITL